MKSFEEGCSKSSVVSHGCSQRVDFRVPAPAPLRKPGCTCSCACSCCCPCCRCCTCCPCCTCEEVVPLARRSSRRPWRRNSNPAWCSLLALLYVVLVGGGSWTQTAAGAAGGGGGNIALAAAASAAAPAGRHPVDSSPARRPPWTTQPLPQTPVPPPRGQRDRSWPRPAATPSGSSVLTPKPPATTPALPGPGPQAPQVPHRGFSQSPLPEFSPGGGGGPRGGRGGGGGAWCASEDAGARAYAATTVFEGKARSRSPPSPGGSYFVTFVVQHVYKDAPRVGGGGAVAAPLLRMRSQVRLQFVEPPPTPAGGMGFRAISRHVTQCEDLSRLMAPGAAGAVRASIKHGGKYLVFADRVGPHNFTVRGAPLTRSRGTVHSIRAVLCPNCVHPPEVWGLRDVTVKSRRRLRLVCRTKGNPPPAVQWFKDGVRVTTSRRVRIQHNKKKSALIIGRVRSSDGGRYECRAMSVIGRLDSTSAAVSVQSESRQDNTTTLWPLVGVSCPFDQYCLNGGTCTYYEAVGELVCQCAEGYKGQRCENKDVINRGSMYRSLSYFCKLGISNSYYC